MRAHKVNQSGLILGTYEVDQLEAGLVDASIGGGPGDSVINGVLVKAAPVVVVPQSVTRRQARRALFEAGLLNTIASTIAAIPDSTARTRAQIDWDDSNDFERTNPTLLALAGLLGLTSQQVDNLFIAAAKL